jgi:restriction system protein
MKLLVALFILLGVSVLCVRAARVPIRHRWRRRQARTMSVALCGIDRNQPAPMIFARLRAMDALAFEELLLESFATRGLRVIRNRRYTGDGGVDGKVVLCGQTWLIQAKRYSSAIRPEHVEAFAALCRRQGKPGLFIHTGRTGGLSRALLDRHRDVQLISGDQLIALVTGQPFAIRGVTL